MDSARAERAHRILDAAAELVLRWGYDKTTIEDVARRAGVAKGTIYLHWSTREALFAALLRRERAALLTDVRSALAASADAISHRDLVQQLGLNLLRRPLVKAVFLGDAEVLGKLLQQKPRSETVAALRPRLEEYLEVLRTHGAVRSDLSIPDLINVIMGTVHGFFVLPPLLPEDYRLADERLAELLSDTVYRALESGRALAPAAAEAISRATLDYLDVALEIATARARMSLGEKKKENGA